MDNIHGYMGLRQLRDTLAKAGRQVTISQLNRHCNSGRIKTIRPGNEWLDSADEGRQLVTSWPFRVGNTGLREMNARRHGAVTGRRGGWPVRVSGENGAKREEMEVEVEVEVEGEEQ